MDENIEVAPSAENGNVPAEAPSEPTIEATPAKVETVEPTVPEVELFELPDGRKVDAETLTKEWKENFLPDYTRKSQELAKTKTENLPTNETSKSPLADPDWQPSSYAELIEIAKQEMKGDLAKEEQQRIEQRQAVENQVISQLESIKKTDPNINENALFLHANKYGFRDLTVAHQNMKDMSELAKSVKQATAKDIAKRNDPVSISPGATGARPNPSQFSTAVEYMRSIK